MEKVLFDPGYSSCLMGISDSVEFVYEAFVSSNMPLKPKRFQFSVLFPKLKAMLTRNVSFYLGCLLWASYIKTIKGAEIENNPCLNTTYDKESSLEEINFLIDFTSSKLNKDAKYYLNSKFEPDSRLLEILNAYSNFIELNKGFVSIKNTDEIKLPNNMKELDEEGAKTVKANIDEAISSKDLTKLFEVYDLILG